MNTLIEEMRNAECGMWNVDFRFQISDWGRKKRRVTQRTAKKTQRTAKKDCGYQISDFRLEEGGGE
jgi:hypothetical protein